VANSSERDKPADVNLLHQPFDARAVHPDFGNEVLGGCVILSAHGLRFVSEAQAWEIPVQRLVAEVRAGDEERIRFTDPQQPGLEIFTEDLSLLDCQVTPALVQARQRLEDRLSRQELLRRIRIVGYCALVCVVCIWLAGVLVTGMVKSLARKIPPQWDEKYGSGVITEMQDEGLFLDDSNAVARLEALAAPLLQVLPPVPNGYHFHISIEEDANAFAMPGGNIVVNAGLLKLADRPEQVVAVIAHEVAHVSERHLYRGQISAAGPLIICAVFMGGKGGPMGLISSGTALVAGAGFSQEFETEADNVGWNYLIAAKIDPRGMAEMFRKFKAEEEQVEALQLPNALSTHPTLDRRIERLEKKWSKLKVKDGFVTLSEKPILQP
jgi:Zn-dependent protease with chaperone function